MTLALLVVLIVALLLVRNLRVRVRVALLVVLIVVLLLVIAAALLLTFVSLLLAVLLTFAILLIAVVLLAVALLFLLSVVAVLSRQVGQVRDRVHGVLDSILDPAAGILVGRIVTAVFVAVVLGAVSAVRLLLLLLLALGLVAVVAGIAALLLVLALTLGRVVLTLLTARDVLATAAALRATHHAAMLMNVGGHASIAGHMVLRDRHRDTVVGHGTAGRDAGHDGGGNEEEGEFGDACHVGCCVLLGRCVLYESERMMK